MPKTRTKRPIRTKGKRGGRRAVATSQDRPAPKRRRRSVEGQAYVVENGRPAYVLVPVDEYERMVKAAMTQSAAEKLSDQDVEWVDADDLALEFAGRRIAQARKAAGLTQKQLGDKLNLPQSQISRIEANPNRATLRTLKKIARALAVDVSALV